jgi:hypothetical protein
MQLIPEAAFDCLFVANRLQARARSFASPELHVFTYLACLLSLYRGRSAADWGYEFVGTELGAPFSQQIDAALRELLSRGYLVRTSDRLQMLELADQRLRDFDHLNLNQERAECLKAACATTAAFSVGMVTSALSQEPELQRSNALPSNRQLLEDAGLSQIYALFEALRGGLNQETSDLRLPAVVWLAALYRAGEATTPS